METIPTEGGGEIFFLKPFSYRLHETNVGTVFAQIPSFKVNEYLQKFFDAEHASTVSHTLASDDDPKL